MGIVIDLDPTIVHFAGFRLQWYSLAIVVAIVVAVVLAVWEGKKRGIPAAEIYGLAPWVVLGGIVGARLVHVIDQWEFYAAHPLHIFMFWQGGLAIWGALLGGGLAVVLYAWQRRLSPGRLADALVPGLLVAQMIGRFGCIVNGDATGVMTDLPWGFIYVNPNSMVSPNLAGVPTHPYPVYEMLWNAATLLLILKVRRHLPAAGQSFLIYLSLYSLGRFVLSFVRQENVLFWGLQQAQIVAIAGLVASLAVLTYLYLRSKRNQSHRSLAQP